MQQVVNNKQGRIKHVTSIGNYQRSMPKNKKKRVSWKRYRGQGKRR